VAEERRGRNPAEPRSVILSQLIADDPQYREYLKRAVQRMLNHQLTEAFLTERFEHYSAAARELQIRRLSYLPSLRQFLQRRRDFFRLISEQWLNAPPSQRVTVNAPPNVNVIIEGELVKDGYAGLYFPDVELAADIATNDRRGFSAWRINGTMVQGTSPLKFKAERSTVIEAVFGTPQSAKSEFAIAETRPTRGSDVIHMARVEWREIPAGESWMGCVPGDGSCDETETPRVRTTFAKGFQMLDREVSAGDFGAFVTANDTHRMPRQPEWYANSAHPVVNVTWDEAQAYCAWVGGRLPTEEEWEYAARGGLDGKLFPWGDDFTNQAHARYASRSKEWDFTAPVASFPANAFGLHDMAGNVWEWTASRHTATHSSDATNDGYDERTIKGGGFDNQIARLRVSQRAALSRSVLHNIYVGFRCVR
jgi:formylglycine-generating enzyme required for sulfatase activity